MDWFLLFFGILLMCIIVIYYVYFYLMRPLPDKENKMEFLLYQPIAHRGLHSQSKNTPENSLKAFQKAIDGGYSIEIDVWLSKDKQVMVFHDGELERMTGFKGHINDLNLKEIKKLRLIDGQTNKITDLEIPTLFETLALVDSKTPLLIEFKGNSNGELEKNAYDILKTYKGKYAVQSFNYRNILWFKKNAPKVIRGQLAMDFSKDKSFNPFVRFVLTNLLTNFRSRPQFVSYQWSGVLKYSPRAFRRLRGKVLCWTVDSPEIARKVKGNVDNIIFEKFIP